MPKKGEQWTAMERVFVNSAAATGDKVYAATKAGYKQPHISGYVIGNKPVIKAEIARREEEILFSEILPLAIVRHKALLLDPKTPPGAAAQLIKLAYDRTLGNDEGAQAKEAHEMTSEELARAIAELERVASDRAKVVEHVEIAQTVRNDDDIFQ